MSEEEIAQLKAAIGRSNCLQRTFAATREAVRSLVGGIFARRSLGTIVAERIRLYGAAGEEEPRIPNEDERRQLLVEELLAQSSAIDQELNADESIDSE